MKTPVSDDGSVSWVRYALLGLILAYSTGFYIQFFFSTLPAPVMVAVQIVPAALFTFLHGAQVYRARGILVFTAICFLIGNIVENLGIRTGFPFGSYYFTDVMGPKLMNVPLLMGPAYLAIGYTSWMLSHVILSPAGDIGLRPRLLTTPLLAACIMVAWDISGEPMWSTIGHFWVWRHGGPYFGVPISNFLGWFLTNYIIFLLFALYLSRQSFNYRVPAFYWRIGVSSYLIMIVAGISRAAVISSFNQVSDGAGVQWKVRHIALTSALASFLLMGTFAFLAGRKLYKTSGTAPQAPAILSEKAASD